jgi:hypothetical protein
MEPMTDPIERWLKDEDSKHKRAEMRILSLTAISLLLVLASGCVYHYRPLKPRCYTPAGTVLEGSDFDASRETTIFSARDDSQDLAQDPARVIGHRTLKPLNGGQIFHYSDISQSTGPVTSRGPLCQDWIKKNKD